MRLANGIVLDKEKTFGELKFSALRHEVRVDIKADDIVLKNKGGQPAGNPQNHAPQGQQKK